MRLSEFITISSVLTFANLMKLFLKCWRVGLLYLMAWRWSIYYVNIIYLLVTVPSAGSAGPGPCQVSSLSSASWGPWQPPPLSWLSRNTIGRRYQLCCGWSTGCDVRSASGLEARNQVTSLSILVLLVVVMSLPEACWWQESCSAFPILWTCN